MNNVFREYLDDFVICYIDDIFIFSKNMEDHQRHVHLVLENCEFYQFEVEFLGYVIYGNDIHMDLHKVQTIVDWATIIFVQNV
jgi:hypothetical protein